jgi:hypothetical protein
MLEYDLLSSSGLALLLILSALEWGIVLLDPQGERCGGAYSRVSNNRARLIANAATGTTAPRTPDQADSIAPKLDR